MAVFNDTKEGHREDDEDSSFVIDLLNGRDNRLPNNHRHGRSSHFECLDTTDAEKFIREMAASEVSDAFDRGPPTWDDGGEYARAAEAVGLDVGGMLEAGVGARKLLEFVASYRRSEGEKLRLLDDRNLKHATSQVLRIGRQMGARNREDNVRLDHTFTREGVSVPVIKSAGTGTAEDHGSGRANRHQPRRTINGRNLYSPSCNSVFGESHAHSRQHRVNLREQEEDDGRNNRCSSDAAREKDDEGGEETTQVCDELLRWGSDFDNAERGTKTKHRSNRLRSEDAISESGDSYAEQSLSAREGSRRQDGRESKLARTRKSVNSVRDRRRSSVRECKQEIPRDRSRNRNDSTGSADEWDEESEEDIDQPSLRPVGKMRAHLAADGYSKPIPSYALPTKHFKNPGRDRGDAKVEDGTLRRKLSQRQAQQSEENSALKLRLEGQRRAIHELEHQAYTLREDARAREEDVIRLKRKIAATAQTSARGTCSCCTSTHQMRAKPGEDGSASTFKKRALAAEVRIKELEKHLADSRAKEQRAREIGAVLKASHSDAQEKVAGLEAELVSVNGALSDAKREIIEYQRDVKLHAKSTKKHRQQHGARTRELEIARAEASDLVMQLRKVSKELSTARDEVDSLRGETAALKSRTSDLERENSLLQERFIEASRWSKECEREQLLDGQNLQRQQCTAPEYKRSFPFQDSRGCPNPTSETAGITQRTGRTGRLGNSSLDALSSPELSESLRHHSSQSREDVRNSSPQEEIVSAVDEPSTRERRQYQMSHVSDVPDERRTRRRPDIIRSTFMRSLEGTDTEGKGGDTSSGRTVFTAGSDHTTMGARYERLQAMYRRVNRRDDRMRGRAGVG